MFDYLPMARNMRQKNKAKKIKARFQSKVSTMVDKPRNMNITVSEMFASIFMKYLIVVAVFLETLCSM